MPAAIPDDERREIAAAVRAGGRRNEVARRFNRSPGSVSKIAAAEGIEFDRSQTKKATAAARYDSQAARMQIIDEGFEKARTILRSINEPRDFQAWTVGLGTLVDKARLETGEATHRGEYSHRYSKDREERFERLFGQLDAYRTGIDDGYGKGDRSVPVDSSSANDTPA